MAARFIDPRIPLLAQLIEIVGSEGRLLAMPLTMALAAPFTELCETEFPLVRAREAQLIAHALRAEGLAWYADVALAEIIDKLDKAQFSAVGRNRKNEHYLFFFGQKRPHEIRRASLERKLATVQAWIEPVKKSPFKGVVALGAELEQRYMAAKSAHEAHKASSARLEQFQTIGEGAAFTTQLNAIRKATMGKLAEMPHKLTGEGLPKKFADGFFLPVRERKTDKEMTPEQIEAQIAQKRAEIAELERDHAEALAKIAAAAAEKAREEAEQAEIDAAEEKAKEAAARAKALKAKRGKKRRK